MAEQKAATKAPPQTSVQSQDQKIEKLKEQAEVKKSGILIEKELEREKKKILG